MKRIVRVALSLIALTPSIAWPAPCCGGHAALPALLTGYESYRFNASWTGNRVIGDAPNEGIPVFRRAQDQTNNYSLGISGALRLGESFQFGAGTAVSTTANAMGDTDLMAGYEVLSRPDQTALTPQLLVFAQISLPTGRSIYESREAMAKDVTGAGFYRFGLGAVALTTKKKWDAFALARLTASAAREFNDTSRMRVSPGLAGDLSAGLGYSINSDWRIGAAIQSSFAEGRKIEKEWDSETTGSTLLWPVQLQATWFKDSNSTFSVTYLDETILGPVHNTTLARSIGIQYSYRWASAE